MDDMEEDFMGKMVAIGGGEIRSNQTLEIDKYIVELSGKVKPKVLFIPTASGDAEGYVDIVKDVYGKQLGCDVQPLFLLDDELLDREIRERILSSDIIYVGGGDTVNMMKVWKRKNVHKYLKEAFDAGVVLSGLSAGSICWFSKGHGEKDTHININGWWDSVQVEGLGLIPAIHCPHYNMDGHESFDFAMKWEDIPGIALDDNCAFILKDEDYKIMKSDKNSGAYILKNQGGEVIKKELVEQKYRPLQEIL